MGESVWGTPCEWSSWTGPGAHVRWCDHSRLGRGTVRLEGWAPGRQVGPKKEHLGTREEGRPGAGWPAPSAALVVCSPPSVCPSPVRRREEGWLAGQSAWGRGSARGRGCVTKKPWRQVHLGPPAVTPGGHRIWKKTDPEAPVPGRGCTSRRPRLVEATPGGHHSRQGCPGQLVPSLSWRCVRRMALPCQSGHREPQAGLGSLVTGHSPPPESVLGPDASLGPQ